MAQLDRETMALKKWVIWPGRDEFLFRPWVENADDFYKTLGCNGDQLNEQIAEA